MLDQLVESKNNQKENRIGFLLTTFVLVVGLFFSAFLWSLFAKDLGMGTDSLELSTLVAPIQAAEAETPPESLPKQEKAKQTNASKSELPTRQTNMLNVEESQLAPDKISVVPNTQMARPKGAFKISSGIENDGSQSSQAFKRETIGDNGGGIEESLPKVVEDVKKIEPPPLIKKAPFETKQRAIITTGGVVNGKATYLPKPIYSAAAKAVKAMGDVNVQVTIDETGNVISAKAVGGHPLLKIEAEKAARNAKFNPTLLSQQPVKVSGIIVYKFSM